MIMVVHLIKMSNAEKDKDVSCFTVDGVVAEMVIEVEENQKVGSEDSKDLSSSPSKDDKKNEETNSAVVDKQEESNVVVLDDGKDGNKNSSENIETQSSSEMHVDSDKSQNVNDNIVEDEMGQSTEESKEVNDQSMEHSSSETTQHSIVNNQRLKRKSKPERSMNGSESDSKQEDAPRYPGRKRLANKRYISEEMITPKHKISESVDNKDISKEEKKRKIEEDSKEKEEVKDTSDSLSTKKSDKSEHQDCSKTEESNTSKEIDVVGKSRPLRKRKISDVEEEKSTSKQNTLRKLPFRKNKDAPDIPDIKPNFLWWNGIGEGQGVRLGDIPEIKERIQKAKSIRALYRVLFFQWPTNGQDLIKQILEFNGFPFDKSSYEFTKRQSIMKIMLDKTIFHMCELLDIRKGDKNSNITNILEFLLRPNARIDPAEDPSWQPVVVLEKMELDGTCFEQSTMNSKLKKGRPSRSSKTGKEKDLSSSITPTRSMRSSSSRKIEIVLDSDSDINAEKSKEDAKSNKTKLPTPKKSKQSEGKSTVNENIILKGVKVTISPLEKKGNSISKDTKKTNTKTIDTKSIETKAKDTKIKDSKTIDTKTKNIKIKDSKTVNTKVKDIKKKYSKTIDTKAKLGLVVKEEKSKTTINAKDLKEKTMAVKKEIKVPTSEEKSKSVEIKSNTSDKLKRPGLKKKKKKFNPKGTNKVPVKSEVPNANLKDDSDEYEIEMTIDSGPDMDYSMEIENDNAKKAAVSSVETTEQKNKLDVVETPKAKLPTVTVSDSSETESAEETKLITASKRTPKTSMKRRGKPLRQFPKISESIQTANFSALQRLHILLFGASDKAENLKSNILSFGGFPFLEGSDEWKQKHFLLSLLAQNNLREYLNLLCIPYASDDQPTMINKLMKFLAVPTEESLDIRESSTTLPIETEVVSSVLVNKSSPHPIRSKGEIKKKVKKKEEKKVSKRPRKVLMSEEEARRLEANFAREQRALARDKKMPVYRPILQKPELNTPSLNMHTYVPQPKSSLKPPSADPEQLNALIQTVYKRRALKAAGAVISTPNKGVKTKLGELENVKFLVVTSNLSDLEILHRLIFMLEASKARIRKNILDFDGFGFNEDSPKYKHRMDYLNSLGYEGSKRISFLLGLCPLNTNLPQQDLNELIMYFLMSPCKTKQTVPITQMPTDEAHIIVKSTAPLGSPIHIQNTSLLPNVFKNPETTKTAINMDHSTPLPKTGSQKARKTFPSSSKISPVKKILLPPSQSPISSVASRGSNLPKRTLLNTIPAVPTYSMPISSTIPNPATNVTLLNPGSMLLNSPKPPANSLVKIPVVNTGSKVQFFNQNQKVAVIDPTATKIPVCLSNIPGQILSNQILIPSVSNKNSVQPSQVQASTLQGSKMVVQSPTAVQSPHEFIVQQQTPDGQQKTFKLIRLPPNHPLVSNASNKVPVQQTISTPQQLLLANAPLSGALPPGIVIMKNSSGLPQGQNLQVLQNAPMKFLPLSAAGSSVSPVISSAPSKITPKEIVSSGEKESLSASATTSLDNSMEIISSSSEDNPPTDEDLFSSIQEIILSSNFEDITLRNVIERVAAQYPNHDLTSRHNYMKECVKKIIIGT